MAHSQSSCKHTVFQQQVQQKLQRMQQQKDIVIYSTFESNEEMYAKLKLTSSTGSGYDLVFPSSYYVNKMAKRRHVTRA